MKSLRLVSFARAVAFRISFAKKCNLAVACVVPILVCLTFGQPADTTSTAVQAKVGQNFAELPLAFEVNQGQSPSPVKFLSKIGTATIYLTANDARFDLIDPGEHTTAQGHAAQDRSLTPPSISHSVFDLQLKGANPNPVITGEEELPGHTNYFIGNDPKNWRTNVANYQKVRYKEIYPGVDLFYYGNQEGRLEHDFVVRAGVDPQQIAFTLDPPQPPQLDKSGDIVLKQGAQEFRLQKPVAYQLVNGARKEVPVRYELAKDEVRFALGDYDKSLELVIDPVVIFSAKIVTWALQAGGGTRGSEIALDSSGNIYLVGNVYRSYCIGTNCVPGDSTNNKVTTCTGPSGCLPNDPMSAYPGDNIAAWIVKLDSTATHVLYSTYLGTGDQNAGTGVNGVGVDSQGRAVISGSSGTGYPVTPTAYSNNYADCTCGYVSMLSADGSSLVYSSLVNASSGPSAGYAQTVVYALAVDPAGRMYITGVTEDADWAANGFQLACGYNPSGTSCYSSAFVAKFDPSLSGTSSLVYFSYLGGSGNSRNGVIDAGFGIAVDANQHVYVTGYTSSWLDFPTTQNAYQPQMGDYLTLVNGDPNNICGCTDAFLTVADTTKTGQASLLYSTFIGGQGYDEATAIALDNNNIAYVTGVTCSPAQNGLAAFPNTNSSSYVPDCPMTAQSISGSTFIAKIDTSKSGAQSLLYSSYYGIPGAGNGSTGSIIAADPAGNFYYVGGQAYALPPLVKPLSGQGTGVGYLAKFDASGNTLYSTFLGGTAQGILERDGPTGIAIDSAGDAIVAVIGDAGFPWYSYFGDAPYFIMNAYVSKIVDADVAGMVPSPSSLTFPNTNVTSSSSPINITLYSTGSQPLAISSVTTSNPEFIANNASACVTTWKFPAGCGISITFAPTGTGNRSGNLIVQSNGHDTQPQMIPLAGLSTNKPLAAFSPATLAFGSVLVNTSVTKAVKLTNSSSVPSFLNINSISLSGYYTQTNNCPAVLNGKASCTISVTFNPTTAAALNGILTLTDSSLTSPDVLAITGTGIQPVTVSPAALTFSSTLVGSTSASQTVTVTNHTSTAQLLAAAASSDFAVTPGATNGCSAQVAGKSSCTYAVAFTPSQNGSISGSLTVSGNFPEQVVDLSGTGSGAAALLSFSPPSLTFTNVALNNTSAGLSVTITNKGTSAVNISGLSGSAGFAASPSGPTPCGGSLGAGKTCNFTVSFTPPVLGAAKGSVSVANDGAINPVLYKVSGTGIAPVTISPSSLNFNTVTVGSFYTETVTVMNNQSVPLTFNSVTASGDYQANAANCIYNSPLPAGSSCQIIVRFWPSKTGTIKGAVTIGDDAPATPQILPLTGIGQ